MTKLRERWEERKPVARVAFFGSRGPEEAAVYEFHATGVDMLAMAIDRRNHLASILVTVPHLVFLVDLNPRLAGGAPADVRVFFDAGPALNVVTSTLSIVPGFSGLWECMADTNGSRVRALFSLHSVQEIVPLHEEASEFSFISVRHECNAELWPELGHKR